MAEAGRETGLDDRPRPRQPRSERVRDQVLAAAGELVLEGGLTAATMEAIAARAGVSKRTLYKYWPSRGAVALEGFMRSAATSWSLPENATAAQSLEASVLAAVDLFTQTPGGPLLRSLIADAQSQSEIARALRDQWLKPRRAVSADLIRQGIGDGEFRADLDIEVVLDLLFAPVYYRLLLGHENLDRQFATASVRHLVAGLSPR
ncbi:MAG TPA: TetR/AcrR family transcriptional regulator [Trebonia sp.]